MFRYIVGQIIWAAAAVGLAVTVLWSWGWIQYPLTPEQKNQVRGSESEIACLAQEMWHGAGKGTGTEFEMRLIGQVATNIHKSGRSYCTIYESGETMMPPKRVGDYKRSVEVVGTEAWATKARSGAAAKADGIARRLIAKDPSVALGKKDERLACVIRFVRSYPGYLWMAVLRGRTALKEELRALYGEPVYTDASTSEFFCPKK